MANVEQELVDAKRYLAEVAEKLQRLDRLRSGEEVPKWDGERQELEDERGELKRRRDDWEMTVQELQRKLPTAAQPVPKFIDLSNYLSGTQIAKQINSRLKKYGSDYSFLSVLSGKEENIINQIFGKLPTPSDDWNDELAQVQPWVQGCYEKLAKIWGLVVNWDSRYGGVEGENYGDHYLTFTEWSVGCSIDSKNIDFTKCWAFEDKRGWQNSLTLDAIRQCHKYSSRFFRDDNNRNKGYVSIITDAKNYRLFHAYYDSNAEDMCAGVTDDICWNEETLQILGRVFKTFRENMFSFRANALPQDFGNNGPKKDVLEPRASNVIPDSEIDFPIRLSELNDLCMDFYNWVLKWSIKRSTSNLPIVKTSFGDVEANVLLGLGPDTAVFGASTTDYGKVAIKFCFNDFHLHREAEILKKLEGTKYVPRLLYENMDVMVSYIVTSMVGRKVTEISAPIACNVAIDILEVLENLHDKGYIHNDIHPGNIVEVDGKFRLIDFGSAVQRFEKRDHIPKHWPKGHAAFASHNRGDYPGARDDLEALCYAIAFMYDQNKLYWSIASRDRHRAHHRKEEKLLFLFDGLPQAFRDFFCCVYDLDFAATVDYGSWQKIFKHAANDLVSPPNLPIPKKRALTPPESPEYKRSNFKLESQ